MQTRKLQEHTTSINITMFNDTNHYIRSDYVDGECDSVIALNQADYLSGGNSHAGGRGMASGDDDLLWDVVGHPVDLDPMLRMDEFVAQDDSEMQNWITSTSETSSVSPSSYLAALNSTDVFESNIFGHFDPYDQEVVEFQEQEVSVTRNEREPVVGTMLDEPVQDLIRSEEPKQLQLPTPPQSETSEQRGKTPSQIDASVRKEEDEDNDDSSVFEQEKGEREEVYQLKKGKRAVIQYPNEILDRVRKYTQTIEKISRDEVKRFGRDVAMLNGPETAGKVSIDGQVYTIVPDSEWKNNYMMYLIPNGYISSVFLVSFQKSMVDDVWVYYDNINEQPHFALTNSKLPLRYCGQIANYYEPFIIREKRKDGRKLTKEEKRARSERRSRGKSKDDSLFHIEALCPYCPIKFDNVNKFDDYFYGRNDSDYLHHVTKHHGVYSDGSEQALPDVVVLDDRGRYYAHCEECELLIKIKNPTGEEIVGNRFLGYLRHCLKHRNRCKNGSGESRLKRRERVVENATREPLFYENGETGELLVRGEEYAT